MDPQQGIVVVQIGVKIDVVGVRVVRISVLVQPESAVGEEADAMEGQLLDFRVLERDCKVTSVMTEGTEKPAGEGEEQTEKYRRVGGMTVEEEEGAYDKERVISNPRVSCATVVCCWIYVVGEESLSHGVC